MKGYLQADAYAGYDCVYAPGKVKEVACWIHARRYWYDAREHDSARANMGSWIHSTPVSNRVALETAYPRINASGERDFVAIAEERQKHSRPLLDEFKRVA